MSWSKLWPVEPGEIVEGDGVADAGDDVLALGVAQVVAVAAGRAGGRVAGEGDTGAGVGPRLPKTIAITLTAVPRSSGMCSWRR